MSRFALIALMSAAPTGAVASPLDAETVRRTFFGVEMQGVLQGTDVSWRECIEPGGRVVYWYFETVWEGRAWVEESGALCFSFADDPMPRPTCFVAYRDGRNFRLVETVERGAVFETRSIRPVARCPALPGGRSR